MKYLFVYTYILFYKIIDAFKPFIHNCFLTRKTNEIIKTFSGLLLQIPYINNKFSEKPVSVIEIEKENCDVKTQDCKIKMIIAGYMQHDPKEGASKHL
jgi:hypothetical protein